MVGGENKEQLDTKTAKIIPIVQEILWPLLKNQLTVKSVKHLVYDRFIPQLNFKNRRKITLRVTELI